MTKKTLVQRIATIVAAVAVTACGSDNPDGPEEIEDIKGEMEELSPTESKKFLRDAAEEFMAKFQAADQREIITLASYFEETYGELDAPKEFEVEPTESRLLKDFFRGMKEAFSQGSPSRAGSAAIVYTYSLNADMFKGVYEPGSRRWTRTESSNDVVFRFKDATGATCEVKAVVSATTSDGQVDYTDEGYEYGDYKVDDEKYVYKFRIPTDATVTVTCGGNTLVTARVVSQIDVDGHTMSVTSNVSAANIESAVKVDGNDSQVSSSTSLSVSGETLVTGQASVTGSRLCDYTAYRDMEDEDDAIAMFKTGTAVVSVLNKVRVDAEGTYNRSVYKAIENQDYDYSSQSEAEKAAGNAIDALNDKIKAEVRYNNKETVQATVAWKYKLDDWHSSYNSYYWYNLDPVLKFKADDTTYSIEEYFENGFASVTDEWETLQRSYEKVWESVRK